MSTLWFILFIVADAFVIHKLSYYYANGDRSDSEVIKLLLGILFIALSAFYIAFYLSGKL